MPIRTMKVARRFNRVAASVGSSQSSYAKQSVALFANLIPIFLPKKSNALRVAFGPKASVLAAIFRWDVG